MTHPANAHSCAVRRSACDSRTLLAAGAVMVGCLTSRLALRTRAAELREHAIEGATGASEPSALLPDASRFHRDSAPLLPFATLVSVFLSCVCVSVCAFVPVFARARACHNIFEAVWLAVRNIYQCER